MNAHFAKFKEGAKEQYSSLQKKSKDAKDGKWKDSFKPKGKDDEAEYIQARPLQALADPKSFPAPPQHRAAHGLTPAYPAQPQLQSQPPQASGYQPPFNQQAQFQSQGQTVPQQYQAPQQTPQQIPQQTPQQFHQQPQYQFQNQGPQYQVSQQSPSPQQFQQPQQPQPPQLQQVSGPQQVQQQPQYQAQQFNAPQQFQQQPQYETQQPVQPPQQSPPASQQQYEPQAPARVDSLPMYSALPAQLASRGPPPSAPTPSPSPGGRPVPPPPPRVVQAQPNQVYQAQLSQSQYPSQQENGQLQGNQNQSQYLGHQSQPYQSQQNLGQYQPQQNQSQQNAGQYQFQPQQSQNQYQVQVQPEAPVKVKAPLPDPTSFPPPPLHGLANPSLVSSSLSSSLSELTAATELPPKKAPLPDPSTFAPPPVAGRSGGQAPPKPQRLMATQSATRETLKSGYQTPVEALIPSQAPVTSPLIQSPQPVPMGLPNFADEIARRQAPPTSTLGKKKPPPPPAKKPAHLRRVDSASSSDAGSGASPAAGVPPPINHSTRPSISGSPSLSRAPTQTNADVELDLSSLWYAQPVNQLRLPPSLQGNNYVCSSSQSGANQRLSVAVRLSTDLSIWRYDLQWLQHDPANSVSVAKQLVYKPPSLTLAQLVQANETFGESVASWAEDQLGRQVGNGECWTLAQQAIARGTQDQAMTSQGLKHGYLVLHLSDRAGGARNPVVSVDEVRRGDIIQYRSVEFESHHGHGTQRSIVGAPDHTAVVTETWPGRVDFLNQNVNGNRTVQKGTQNFDELTKGDLKVYRVVWKDWAGELTL